MARKKILISKLPTKAPKSLSKKAIEKKTKELTSQIRDMVTMMYANRKHSLLIVLQGMDSSGKDGVSRVVFGKVSPTMVHAFSFKKPTDEEFAHDFLWRVNKQSPQKGHVKIYVRSHYEDILIQRVHKWIDTKTVNARIDAINAYERNLMLDNNTIVMKFFLNLSKARQKEKLIERIEDPEKNYKHNDGDWEERKHWRKYMNAYQDAINRSDIPWIPVPADDRWYRNYFVAKQVADRLKKLKQSFPVLQEKPKIDFKNA